MAVLAIAITTYDLELLPWEPNYSYDWKRIAPALVTVIIFAVCARGRGGAIGLRLRPLPSGGFWIRATVGTTLLFAVIIGITFAIYAVRHGITWPADVAPPSTRNIGNAVIGAPVVEEAIYRWALVTGLVALVPRWAAVLLSGVAFGYLHFVYNGAAPNNVIAGFVFAWIYLKSGHIGMPIAFHALGNGAVIAINAIIWQLMT